MTSIHMNAMLWFLYLLACVIKFINSMIWHESMLFSDNMAIGREIFLMETHIGFGILNYSLAVTNYDAMSKLHHNLVLYVSRRHHTSK